MKAASLDYLKGLVTIISNYICQTSLIHSLSLAELPNFYYC